MTKRKAPAPAPAKPVAVPVSPQAAWRWLGWGFGTLGLAAVAVWITVAGWPQRATLEAATLAADAGFVVRQVDIEGMVNQPRLSVYRQVLEGGSDSMLLTDIEAIRARVRALPWVRDASVERRWPNRLVIRIVEKKPVAVWQHQGVFRLIDETGKPLPSERVAEFVHLPQLVGRDANMQAAGLLTLVAQEPKLMQALDAAVWVGDRRWDLRMKSGETLSLPEGPAAPQALQRFAAIERDTPLLGRGFVRFDLRIPDKMVVRVSGEVGATAKPRAQPKAPANGAVGPAVPGVRLAGSVKTDVREVVI
jgi:cell division protein FtsQ